MRSYKQGDHLCPVLARKPKAHNHSQEESLNHHQDKERLWLPEERSVWRLLQMWPPLTSRRKDLHFHELQRHRARNRKRNLKRKRRTINLLLPGTLFRMMFAPVPTMTIHFMLFVFFCPSLVLMWWRPCTLGYLSLTCVHKRPPSPPFNCFVPHSTLFHPFTTLSINLNFNVTFPFVITCFFVSYFASACMYIIVLVVCCKYHFWSCTSLEKKDPKTFGTKPAMKRSLKLLFVALCAIFLVSEPSF